MNTPTAWSDIGFEVEMTGDGSPSLRQLRSRVLGEESSLAKGESMHHSGGAAEETELIYGQPIRKCLQGMVEPHFVSVGLGLGYVELVIAREALENKRANVTLESWESIPELKARFLAWILGVAQEREINDVYDRVLGYVLAASEVLPRDLKAFLARKFEGKEWILQDALEKVPAPQRKTNGLLFDAFSAKTSPALWNEEFLQDYFTQTMAKDSFISTYASRTSLKNALRTCGFAITIRPGFKSKRNSTLGVKGLLEATFAPAETF